MTNFIQILSGKKTYLVSITTIIYAIIIIGWQQGDITQMIELIFAALGLGALRNGMKQYGR